MPSLEKRFLEGMKPIRANKINCVKPLPFDYVERYFEVEG
jgi:hypothetical protein